MPIPSFNHYSKYFEQSHADGYTIHQVELGHLAVPSGKIIASDPFYSFQQRPLSKQVPPGNYLVKLAIAEIEPQHYKIGLAKIQFSEQKAVKWELAVSDDILPEELAELAANEFIGYEVGSGLGMFLDAETNEKYIQVLQQFYANDESANYYDEVLAGEFATSATKSPYSHRLGDWLVHCPTGNPNENIMMFAAGWGEGLYPSYWGLDASGQIVALITDFLVFIDFD